MENSNLKGVLGALALIGVVAVAKKMSKRRAFIKDIFEEYDIKEKTPFGFADKIRELNDEQYAELKNKIKSHFASHKCHSHSCKQTEKASS